MSSALDDIQITVPIDKIADFCHRWGIAELALFGSVLRDDFGADSDIDVLVTFAPDTEKSADREVMGHELSSIFGRPVDVTYRRVIERTPNYIIRKSILRSARVIYAA